MEHFSDSVGRHAYHGFAMFFRSLLGLLCLLSLNKTCMLFFLRILFHKQHAALLWSDLWGFENVKLYYFTSTCTCGISHSKFDFIVIYRLLKVSFKHVIVSLYVSLSLKLCRALMSPAQCIIKVEDKTKTFQM